MSIFFGLSVLLLFDDVAGQDRSGMQEGMDNPIADGTASPWAREKQTEPGATIITESARDTEPQGGNGTGHTLQDFNANDYSNDSNSQTLPAQKTTQHETTFKIKNPGFDVNGTARKGVQEHAGSIVHDNVSESFLTVSNATGESSAEGNEGVHVAGGQGLTHTDSDANRLQTDSHQEKNASMSSDTNHILGQGSSEISTARIAPPPALTESNFRGHESITRALTESPIPDPEIINGTINTQGVAPSPSDTGHIDEGTPGATGEGLPDPGITDSQGSPQGELSPGLAASPGPESYPGLEGPTGSPVADGTPGLAVPPGQPGSPGLGAPPPGLGAPPAGLGGPPGLGEPPPLVTEENYDLKLVLSASSVALTLAGMTFNVPAFVVFWRSPVSFTNSILLCILGLEIACLFLALPFCVFDTIVIREMFMPVMLAYYRMGAELVLSTAMRRTLVVLTALMSLDRFRTNAFPLAMRGRHLVKRPTVVLAVIFVLTLVYTAVETYYRWAVVEIAEPGRANSTVALIIPADDFRTNRDLLYFVTATNILYQFLPALLLIAANLGLLVFLVRHQSELGANRVRQPTTRTTGRTRSNPTHSLAVILAYSTVNLALQLPLEVYMSKDVFSQLDRWQEGEVPLGEPGVIRRIFMCVNVLGWSVDFFIFFAASSSFRSGAKRLLTLTRSDSSSSTRRSQL